MAEAGDGAGHGDRAVAALVGAPLHAGIEHQRGRLGGVERVVGAVDGLRQPALEVHHPGALLPRQPDHHEAAAAEPAHPGLHRMTSLSLHPDRLFPADTTTRAIARRLYAEIEHLPIISPHGHTDPAWFADNAPFSDAASLLIVPDHYVFRML